VGSAAGGTGYTAYGVERTSSANDAEKFATYYRDAKTGLDYAINRYYWSGLGRFLTADPYEATADGANNPVEPQSWNRYAYVLSDPMNGFDPTGLFIQKPQDWGWGGVPLADIFGFQRDIASYPTPRQKQQARSEAKLYERLEKAYVKAIEALHDPNCAGLFNTSGRGLNPETLLRELYNGGQYGSISFADLGPARKVGSTATWTNATTTGISIHERVEGQLVHAGLSGVNIKIHNDKTAPWSEGSLVDNAITLLHELGHAFMRIMTLADLSYRTTLKMG
jgi:RHS repeat-associated protein